ncbi:small serum protein 2-like [Heteronotia binoei]|uniref:small serum protein 2-like n=1 Tax=Heteronotia binoei TaxID=13085 RepID=UPI00292DF354|nr:small serum protein 2-like [Heteronotia binoei]
MWVVDSSQTQASLAVRLFLTGKSLLAAYRRDRMNVLLSLSVLCITLALCQAACFTVPPKVDIRNGVLVTQSRCKDLYNRQNYQSGSEWNTAHCLRCSCHGGTMECCNRFGGVAHPPPGCKALVNPKTCRYEFYRIKAPSKSCF